MNHLQMLPLRRLSALSRVMHRNGPSRAYVPRQIGAEMTILVEKCLDCMKKCFDNSKPGEEPYRADRIIARDIVCPDGGHMLNQEWTLPQLRELLDTGAPLFHCAEHGYKWNPDLKELESIRSLTNTFDGGGLP
jgi:hypothetical protein